MSCAFIKRIRVDEENVPELSYARIESITCSLEVYSNYNYTRMTINDKVVWITGASSGIGEALAYEMASRGARLALSSRNTAELERVKNNCAQPAKVAIFPLDVCELEQIRQVAAAVIDLYGQVDILVANAGISQRSLVRDTDISVDVRIMQINYLGAVAAAKAVLPQMISRKTGQIVVISSVLGKIGTPLRSAYAGSKHALHGFFDSLRAEVAKDNVKVTIICPGYVKTNVTINALTGDGTSLNKMAAETAQGMEPAFFARKAVNAIIAEKEEPIIGKWEVTSIYMKRFFPGLLSRIIRSIKFEVK